MKNDEIKFKTSGTEKPAIQADAKALGMTTTDYILRLWRHMRVPFARKMKAESGK